MVRVNLEFYNKNPIATMLNFSSVGSLVLPITAREIQVLKFSIPNSDIPIFDFKTNTYYFRLSYKTFSFTQYIVLEDRGSGSSMFEFEHLVSMMNTTLKNAVSGLDAVSGHTLQSTVSPYIIYNSVTGLYSLIAPTNGYDSSMTDPIRIHVNRALFYILQTLPVYNEYTITGLYEYYFLFKNDLEHTYNTSYLRITQESITLSNYAYMRSLIIASNLPCQSEIITSNDSSSNQSQFNILSSYTIPYEHGSIDLKSNTDYSTISERYRITQANLNNFYDLKCLIFYKTNENKILPMSIPPFTSAFLVLEFIE